MFVMFVMFVVFVVFVVFVKLTDLKSFPPISDQTIQIKTKQNNIKNDLT